VLGFFIHYTRLVSERDTLRTDNTALTADLAKAAANAEKRKENARVSRVAAAEAVTERDTARAALDKLRAARANDPEAQEWGAQFIPQGELERFCETLPEMVGCLVIAPSN
jgi:hypothetical protein